MSVTNIMKYPIAWTLTALLVLGTGTILAQGKGQKMKVVLQGDSSSIPGDTVNLVRNAIKLNPALFLRGETPIYYERARSPRMSVVVAAGITNRKALDLPHSHERSDDYGAGTKVLSRPAIHGGLRFYLTKDMEAQGFYFQGEYVYLDHSKDISIRDAHGRFTGASLRDQSIFKDGRLYFGYQRLASTSNWLFDVYGGVGYRSRELHQVNERMDLMDGQWTVTQEVVRDDVMAYFLGVKLGYGF